MLRHLLAKRKISNNYLKKINIFIFCICHYIQTYSCNKPLISILTPIIFYRYFQTTIRLIISVIFDISMSVVTELEIIIIRFESKGIFIIANIILQLNLWICCWIITCLIWENGVSIGAINYYIDSSSY